jgi:hypothetical protein
MLIDLLYVRYVHMAKDIRFHKLQLIFSSRGYYIKTAKLYCKEILVVILKGLHAKKNWLAINRQS